MSAWHSVIRPITFHFRAKRGKFLLEQFPNILSYKILDLGGSRHFWESINLNIPHYNIVIYNISDGEMNVSPKSETHDIQFKFYDGEHLPEHDQSFDLVVCNSVIEHVPQGKRADLAREMMRVGKRVFCQTPAFEFPIEPHFVFPFIHWLPRSIGYQLAKISPWRLLGNPSSDLIKHYWWETELLSHAQMMRLFPHTNIVAERVLSWPKSWYAIKK